MERLKKENQLLREQIKARGIDPDTLLRGLQKQCQKNAKRTAKLLLLLAPISLFAQTVLLPLAFDYPMIPEDKFTNTVFRLHASTNIAQAVTNWSVVPMTWIVDTSNPSLYTLSTSNKVPAIGPLQFFSVSASNEFGMVFSDPLSLTAPRQGRNLRVPR